ncbi:3-deoxy-D-manno-octulosonic acid transferase [Labilibacter sediminis]|nr:3-deoxy-D-manno-octulosonic acid transferase [Labilibacter sediminis]
MLLIYNIGISLYGFIIALLSPFNDKAQKLYKGRKDTQKRIKNLHLTEKTIWVHCASLGEFEQGRPIIEAIKSKNANTKVVLTFFSPSGYEVQKDYALADYVFYLPADRPATVRRFVSAINPEVAIFVKYEFWYHFLKHLHHQNIKTYIVSAIFRKQHAFFKWYGGWYRKMLTFFTMLYVQDDKSAQLLSEINVHNYQVSGDTRFDRVYEISQKAKEYPALAEFAANSKVLVGGSTWPTGEDILVQYLLHNAEVKLLLAPHEIHEEHIKQIEEKLVGVTSARYTQLEGVDLKSLRVLIVDTMGMLSSMYRYGHVAYIGGGFGSGIHNTIEASTFGLPVIFGPNYKKYQEACDLVELNAGFVVESSFEFNKVADDLLLNDDLLRSASKKAIDYVDKMRGATESIVAAIFEK